MTYQEKIINLITNEITFRDYTKEEIAEVEAAQNERALIAKKAETDAIEKTALLERLGITAAEAKLLLS